MNLKKISIQFAAVAVMCCFAVASLEAQIVLQNGNGQIIPQNQTFGPPQQTYVQPIQNQTFGPQQQTFHQHQQQTFGQPQPRFDYPRQNQIPYWALRQHPHSVTANQVIGYNPWGGVNTYNEQVDNTYFAPNRDLSRNNGTMRYVTRPVYGANGQVVGQEQGYVWKNSITGAEHKELEQTTINDKGGTHKQIHIGF